MNVTFRHWESGYTFHYGDDQVAAGLYDGAKGFELLEDSGLTTHSNAMCAFSYLKDKYESDTRNPKQATIDLFTPRERSDSEVRKGQRII